MIHWKPTKFGFIKKTTLLRTLTKTQNRETQNRLKISLKAMLSNKSGVSRGFFFQGASVELMLSWDLKQINAV